MNELNCTWISATNDVKRLPKRAKNKGLNHYFPHPLLACMFKNYYYYGYKDNSKLYEVVPSGWATEGPIRYSVTNAALVKELEISEVTLIQKVAFSILCTLEVCEDPAFIDWAKKWLSGEDRSEESASTVYCNVANDAACYAVYPITKAASYVPTGAGHPIYGPDFYALNSVGWAIRIAQKNNKHIDLISLAKRAMQIQ